MANIGDRIKLRRKELKMSVDELAIKLNKDRATIYRYENGDIEKLPVTIMEPLSKALNTTIEYLMGWELDTSILDESTYKLPVIGYVRGGEPNLALQRNNFNQSRYKHSSSVKTLRTR